MKVTDVLCSLCARSVCVMTVALSPTVLFECLTTSASCSHAFESCSSVTCVYSKNGSGCDLSIVFRCDSVTGKGQLKGGKKLEKRGYTRFSIEFNLEGREIQ